MVQVLRRAGRQQDEPGLGTTFPRQPEDVEALAAARVELQVGDDEGIVALGEERSGFGKVVGAIDLEVPRVEVGPKRQEDRWLVVVGQYSVHNAGPECKLEARPFGGLTPLVSMELQPTSPRIGPSGKLETSPGARTASATGGARVRHEGNERQALCCEQLGAQPHDEGTRRCDLGHARGRNEEHELGRLELQADGLGRVALRQQPPGLFAGKGVGLARLGQHPPEAEPYAAGMAALPMAPGAHQHPGA